MAIYRIGHHFAKASRCAVRKFLNSEQDNLNNFDTNSVKQNLIPLSVLATKTPYSAEYLSLRARRGKLPAQKIDNVWHSTENDVNDYIKRQEVRNQFLQNG